MSLGFVRRVLVEKVLVLSLRPLILPLLKKFYHLIYALAQGLDTEMQISLTREKHSCYYQSLTLEYENSIYSQANVDRKGEQKEHKGTRIQKEINVWGITTEKGGGRRALNVKTGSLNGCHYPLNSPWGWPLLLTCDSNALDKQKQSIWKQVSAR